GDRTEKTIIHPIAIPFVFGFFGIICFCYAHVFAILDAKLANLTEINGLICILRTFADTLIQCLWCMCFSAHYAVSPFRLSLSWPVDIRLIRDSLSCGIIR